MMAKSTRGTMVVSLDLELSWGRFDKMPLDKLEAESLKERPQIRRLLALMDQYEIPATWAVVGHLMLDGCTRDPGGNPHSDIVPHARYSWFPREWYCYDPCTTASLAPGWYAPDIVEWIRETRARHEIASHSFAHVCYGDPECSPAVALADLTSAVETASQRGITLKSFIFPRNQVGYLELLRRAGLRAYRGVSPPPHNILPRANAALRKAITAAHVLLGFPPPSVYAEEVLPGLWNIPANHCYPPHEGMYRLIPHLSRVARARNGIKRAVKNGGLYHLWFHPFDFNKNSDAKFRCLEQIFSYAHGMREKGVLDILTMDEYSRRLAADKAGMHTSSRVEGHALLAGAGTS